MLWRGAKAARRLFSTRRNLKNSSVWFLQEMDKTEAINLIGKTVQVATAVHGCYTGILEEVICSNGRPWRGVVTITSILAPPVQPSARAREARPPRMPFEIGSKRTFTGGIRPFPGTTQEEDEGANYVSTKRVPVTSMNRFGSRASAVRAPVRGRQRTF